MASIEASSDDSQPLKVVHNAQIDKIVIRVGWNGSIALDSNDEARTLVDQLHDAITAQTRFQGRLLTRDEDEIRSAATIREALQ